MYLETERLTVRYMLEADFPDWAAYAMDPDSCRMRGTTAYTDPAQVKSAFEWLLNREKRFYAIEWRAERKVVGHIVVYNFPEIGEEPEVRGMTGRALSFCVSGPYRRRGVATEALTAVIGFLFDARGVEYISSGYYDFNLPSRRLHEKLGFTPISSQPVILPGGEKAQAVTTVLFNPHAPRAFTGEISEK